VEVQRLDGHHVLTAGAREPEANFLHGLDVLRPLLHERDVVAGFRQHAADDGADGPCPDDADPGRHVFLRW